MAEDPQPQTIQQRIAMLNATQVGRMPGELPIPRSKPSLSVKRPNVTARQHSINNPPAAATISVPTLHNEPNGHARNRPPPPTVKAAPPPLPSRRPSEQPSRSPALPPRRPSVHPERRDSIESTSSAVSGISSLSLSRSKSRESTTRVKAPAWGEATLPPLPTKQAEQSAKSSQDTSKYDVRVPVTKSNGAAVSVPKADVSKPALPPRLPPRQPTETLPVTVPTQSWRTRDDQAVPTSRSSALSFGMNRESSPPQTPPSELQSAKADKPPPVPLASRPDLAKIQATKPRPKDPSIPPSSSACMICRDFSGPDNHAAEFPRQSLPSQNSIAYLGQQLAAPFPSPTDKARAIFTWLHFNILYDVDSFFAHSVKPSTPSSTLSTGLAVCEGYAALFTAIATHAGLESVVISGHGKGFGYTALAPGQAPPPYQGNHAWNAVKIDGGEWKLIDSTWGAGHVEGAGMPYAQMAHPMHFTMSNEEFGIRHYPNDRSQFYLPAEALVNWNWETYIMINPANWPTAVQRPTVFSNALEDYGVGEKSVLPASKKIKPQGGMIRFQFGHPCGHYTLAKHNRKGPPFVYVLAIHGVDGRKDDFVPLRQVRGQNPGGGGDLWYVDVEGRELGTAGQSITMFAVTSFGDKKGDACRGLTVQEYLQGKGRMSMGFGGLMNWQLV